MLRIQSCIPRVLVFVWIFVASLPYTTDAAMPESMYLENLKIAEKSVVKATVRARSMHSTLSSSNTSESYPVPFKIGDTWRVITWLNAQSNPNLVGRSETSETVSSIAILNYEIIEVMNRPFKVTVRIVPEETDSVRSPDPKVSHILVTWNDALKRSEKTVFLRGNDSGFKVSDLRGKVTPLELLPIEFPNFSSLEKSNGAGVPRIPKRITELLAQMKLNFDASSGAWLEYDDLFGRPVRLLWNQDEPWPRLMTAPGSVSLLIQKRKL